MENGWKGLPFRPISEFYQQRFGSKVYKIPVSVVDDCPNRRGLKGMQTCIFCAVWGSAARSESFSLGLREQIEKFKPTIGNRFKSENFLVYFQAYTNTFTKIDSLRINFETALSFPFVKGLVVGTRPDCISKSVMDLWSEYNNKTFVAVELGVQSFFDDQLEFLRRGHTGRQSIEAMEKIAKNTSVDLGIHLMFGQPGETDEQMITTANIVNSMPITNVKIHNLHVLTNTPLETLFHQGKFTPIDLPTYARRLQIFLEHLSPRIYIHRLAAMASRWEELVSPQWTRNKMETHQYLVDTLWLHGSYQSAGFLADSIQDRDQQKRLLENSLPLNTLIFKSLRKRMQEQNPVLGPT